MLLDILEIFIIFIVPILLWYFKIIKSKYRWQTFVATCLMAVGIIIAENWPLEKLGIRVDNLVESAIAFGLLTLFGSVAVWLLAKKFRKTGFEKWHQNPQILFSACVFAALQEFAFRGFLMPKLEGIFSHFGIIVTLNALLFVLPHLIYKEKLLLTALTFVAGLAWAGTYFYFPNLIIIIISHSILNFLTVSKGFFELEEAK